MAEPPAPAMSSAVTIGLASRTTPRTATAPVKLCAPICLVRLPICSASTAPNGIETSAVGKIVTLATNQACWTNSANWNGRLNRPRRTSSEKAKNSPAPRTGARGDGHQAAITAVGIRRRPCGTAWWGPSSLTAFRRLPASRAPSCAGALLAGALAGLVLRAGGRPGRWRTGVPARAGARRVAVRGGPCRSSPGTSRAAAHAVLAEPGTGLALGHRVSPLLVGQLDRDGRQGTELGALLGLQLSGVLLLGHPDRSFALRVEELADDRLVARQQHLARTEHRQVPAVEQADVVRDGAGGVHVVRDDQEGRLDLGVEVDDQLVEVGGADRVETRVRLVEQQDLRVEHERSGQAGALAHAAGDLTGELLLRAGRGRRSPSCRGRCP